MPRAPIAVVLEELVAWYAARVYGVLEGPGRVPFYCDPARVGGFAVAPAALAAGTSAAVFQLYVTLAMYQSRRDVDVMEIQRAMPRPAARAMVQPRRLALAVDDARCGHLRTAEGFDAGCSVYRVPSGGASTCADRPRAPCHVKDATAAIGRMGDMGKLPTSAWLHLRDQGDHGFDALLARVTRAHATPAARAAAMVAALAAFYRVGEKLATFIVATLTVPELAPGLTPWHPALDGHGLVIVDANLIRVIDALRPRGVKTYAARAGWWRRHAARVDLRRHRIDWPATSPRLVQQAAYWFRSRSNRDAAGLACDGCRSPVCPYCAG